MTKEASPLMAAGIGFSGVVLMMRDQEYIIKAMTRLAIVWKRNPTLRLGQLIENVYHHLNDNHCYYHVEDDEFISALESFYGRKKQSSCERDPDSGNPAAPQC